MTEKKQEITAEQAREALEKEKNVRLEACATELVELLKRHNCRLDAVPMIADGRIVARVEIGAS